MYLHSGLGQQQVTAVTTRQRVAYPGYYAPGMVYPGYYPTVHNPAVNFVRSEDTGAPGQPYKAQFNPEEVEKAVYQDLPKETEEQTKIEGTEPQKVIKLKSGLEVPAYILQREAARKEAERNKKILAASVPPPKYHKIGMFATTQPLKTAIAAIGLGYIAGHIAYALQH